MSKTRSADSSARQGERRGGCTLGGVVGGEMDVGDSVCWNGLTLGNTAAGVMSGAVRGFAVVGVVSGNLGDGLVAMGKFRFENLCWVDCRMVWFFSGVLTGPVPLHLQLAPPPTPSTGNVAEMIIG